MKNIDVIESGCLYIAFIVVFIPSGIIGALIVKYLLK